MRAPLPDDGIIRKLWVGESAAYRDHLLRLDAISRNSRFGGGVSDDYVIRHAAFASAFGVVVIGFFVDGVLRGAAELRPADGPFSREAEVALSVESAWQSLGVGTALLARALTTASNRGIRALHLYWNPDNARIRQLAGKFGAKITRTRGGVAGEFAPLTSTPLSIISEAFDDATAFAAAWLDAQQRLLAAA